VLLGVAIVAQYSRGQRAEQANSGASILYALGAALCFGMFYIIADQGTAVAQTMPLWVTLGGRASGLSMLLVVQLLRARQLPWPGGGQAARLGLIGVVDVAATGMFTLGTLAPNLGIVAVLGSLYPVVTILLSRLFLGERLSTPQLLGIGVILVGIVLVSLP
jgi:drug/metabolite transporter (DMT)-like permease